jgi:hypothetical protein
VAARRDGSEQEKKNMELKFESFGLPTDGLTKVEEIDSYGCGSLCREGWSMVGLVSAPIGSETKLYGVFRMTSDVALVKALDAQRAAEKTASDATNKIAGLERQLKETMALVSRQDAERAAIDAD